MTSGRSYGVIDSADELQKLVSRMISDDLPFAFDLETGYDGAPKDGAALHPEEGFICGFSMTNDTSWARYIPIRHDMAVNVEPQAFSEIIWPLLETGNGVAHNAKFEGRFLSEMFRDEIPDLAAPTRGHYPIRSDTLIESYMLAETQGHGLKFLTKTHFNHDQAELSSLFPDLAKNKMKTLRFNALELTPQVVAYACEDSVWTLMLHELQYPRVSEGPLAFLFGVELSLLEVLIGMEEYGVLYDWPMMASSATDLEQFLSKYHQEINADLTALTGGPININLSSSAQISKVLFDQLGLRTTRMTKSSEGSANPKMSTDKIALAGLAKQYPVVDKMTKWKELRKLHGTYLEKYERVYGYAPDGRTHPNMLQCAVLTGRFAVSDPPYQQTPKKYKYQLETGEHFDLNFRNLIKSSADHYLIGYDYSQVELRWLAGVSQEPKLLNDFRAEIDVHTTTASLMLNVPADKITKDQRAVGKTMNFALLYGMQAKSLGERLGISKSEAERLYDAYFSAFSSIAVWVNRVTAQGKLDKFTTSHFGRKHRIWEFDSPEHWIRNKGERMCVNAPIQGGAADYMKVAMVRQHKALAKAGLLDKVHLIMNIHDALIYEVHQSVTAVQVMECVEPAISYDIPNFPPIRADWSIGKRWGNMKDIALVDGKIVILGADVVEKAPEIDEETGEPVIEPVIVTAPEIAPVTQPTPAQKTFEGTAVPETPILAADEATASIPRDVMVTLADMPDTDQFGRFKSLLGSLPGQNSVTLVVGDQSFPMAGTTGLNKGHDSQVSLIFHGANVHYGTGSVDTSDILNGLSL